MKSKVKRSTPKRMGAMLVSGTMLMQAVVPVYATVSQVPALFVSPPDTNVMFTLDDSGSMQSDAIPDFPATGAAVAGVPSDANSAFFFPGRGVSYPNMWGASSSYRSTTYYDKNNAVARYMRSSSGNPLYYDPKVTYLPWPTAANDQVLSAPAIINAGSLPAAVRVSTDSPFSGGLLADIKSRVNVSGAPTAALAPDNPANNYWPATYFIYTGSVPLPFAAPNTPLNTFGSFTKVEIKPSVTTYARDAARTDCTGSIGPGGCTYTEELQNFANWLQYYRNRRLMAKGGVASAFSKQGSNLRVGFASINSSPVVRRGVAQFTGAARTAFYNDLYPLGGTGVTPLRKAMDDVGQYFQRSNIGNPWAQDPTSAITVGKEYACRRSFHILSTDGFWNDAGATAPASGNNDAFSGQTPPKGPSAGTGPRYTYSDLASSPTDPLVERFGISPFNDSSNNTLADVAAYYWKSDLRLTIDNDVATSALDPAFWQHLTTYTVGLGISGTGNVRRTSDGSLVVPASEPVGSTFFPYIGLPWLATPEMRELLVTKRVGLSWTAPVGDDPETGDDLIHAAMNGHGRYFSATNPKVLATSLASALNEATSKPASLTSLAVESIQVENGNDIYQAIYNPDKWYGRLYAFNQAASGTVDTTPGSAVWEASNKMPAPLARNIFTWNPLAVPNPTATAFFYPNLNTTQQGYLANDPTLVDYLRGSAAKEVQNGGLLRDRSRYPIGAAAGGVLGDIINGSPIKGPEDGGGFNRLPSAVPGQSTYAAYRADILTNTTLNNLRKTLFVGANDGMLHAFDTVSGVERFAFVPNSVYGVPRSLTGTEAKLKMLSDPAYTHRMLVDGPPQIADAYDSSAWKTYLLSSTGAGARSVFAMDVTNPVVETGGFDKSKILWEFSESNNADMGYVINYPHLARMKSKADGTGGAWVAIFGNGYDSVNGQAKLFILDLFTGAVVKEISVGAAGGNGLSQPNFTVNNKREVTAIYAGDLKGNLWKFDVDFDDSASYKVAFSGAPLYAGSDNQPITVMPEITFHPNGGTLVSFGTGKIFETEDLALTFPPNKNLNTQSLIGIWDKPSETAGLTDKTKLVQQQDAGLAVAADTTLTGTTTNPIDWTTKRGWYMNLAAGGERVNVNPQQVKSILLMVANKPDSDPCKTGGSSRLFALDPITGGAPGFGVLDANASGSITAADKGYNVKAISYAVLSLPSLQKKSGVIKGLKVEATDSRGKTGERLGGVEDKPISGGNDCDRWLLAGGSDTSIAGFDISVCSKNKPRISWRQLQ